MEREYLSDNTYIRFPGGECYKINSRIGRGGGSLLYSACKMVLQDGKYEEQSRIRYALKECFPYSEQYDFVRNSAGEIRPVTESQEAEHYLHYVAAMQLNEGKITSEIYETEAIRMVPILHLAGGAEVSQDQGESFHYVSNTYTVMASLENKGESVTAWYGKEENHTAAAIFSVIRQVLLALREVHGDSGSAKNAITKNASTKKVIDREKMTSPLIGSQAQVMEQVGGQAEVHASSAHSGKYVHLDIQAGNIFVTGDWRDQSLTCFLIDFGSARRLLEDGRCAPVGSEPIFSSLGYRAPEIAQILSGENREFRLGKEADLYSVGYLLLYLLTGTRYSDELLARFRNKYDKNYLTRKNIQELNVPAYVEELIQHILAKALEPDPEKRYGNTDAMLKDVDKVLEALLPSHSRISGLAYDGYILYDAKEPVCKIAAQTLQKRLEHFRASGLKRIRRVFLDSTEVSADVNRDKQTVEALKASGYLIIVGGADPESAIWQAKEVKFFLRFHPVSHVLVMVTGVEKDASEMPVIRVAGLGRAAVLAADARGGSEKEIRKKIKKEAAIRIAAPLLSVPYDGLVQRYRRYRRRKFGSIAAVVAVTLTGFGAHAAYQAYQIQIQHTLASQNRALNLCNQAMALYEKGDKKGALETAILPYEEEKTNWSVVPEQVYALNTIMGAYSSGKETMFEPLGIEKIEEDEMAASEDTESPGNNKFDQFQDIRDYDFTVGNWRIQRDDQGLTVYDLQNNTQTVLTTACAARPVLVADNLLAVIEYQEGQQDPNDQMDIWSDEKGLFTPVLYDLTTGKEVCRLETENEWFENGKGNCVLELDHMGKGASDVWACWIGQKLWLVDLEDGKSTEVDVDVTEAADVNARNGKATADEKNADCNFNRIADLTFHSEIAAVEPYSENEFLVGLSSGSVISVTVSDGSLSKKLVYEGNGTLYDFSCDAQTQTLDLYTEQGVVHCGKPKDSRMTDVDITGLFGESYEIAGVEQEDTYTYMWFGDTNRQKKVYGSLFFYNDAVAVYRTLEEEPLFTYKSDGDWKIQDVQMKVQDGQEAALVLETRYNENYETISRITLCPVKGGESRILATVTGLLNQIQYNSDLTGAYLCGNLADHNMNLLFYIDFQAQEISEISLGLNDVEHVCDILVKKADAEGDIRLELISPYQNQIRVITYSTLEKKILAQKTLSLENDENYGSVEIVQNRDCTNLLIYDRSGSAWVLDAETLEVLHTLNVGEKRYLDMCFFRDSTCLLGADEESVWLYNLEEEKMESVVYMDTRINCSPGKKLRADESGPFFGFWDSMVYTYTAADNGANTQYLHLFWADDDLQIHKYADVEGGFKPADSWGIMSLYGDRKGFAYGGLGEFDELYGLAKEWLEAN
ncbi:protein kinase domain-containing protein [Blautia sp. Sow4_E7]|uniref:protein kinase domain-containing protein n=1 Tax=Blautia sp. Sow4_E7 TaxID=3438749 RepID=UPI003F92190D